jgi:PIN domain nuclease of toxin-antitoxin system
LRVLLDTAVLIFAVESPGRLSKAAFDVLSNPENTRELSALSVSEIAIKAARHRLIFSLADTQRAIEDLYLRILPYTMDHAFRLYDLPLHHSDPFDRQIIAQALYEEIPIITSDEKFSLYKDLEIIW